MIAHILEEACLAIRRELAAAPDTYEEMRVEIDDALQAMWALRRTLDPQGIRVFPVVPTPHPWPPSVQYNGVPMHPSWPAQIERAQRKRTLHVEGRTYARIPYGMETLYGDWRLPLHETLWLPPTAPCGCGVLPGQLHVESCSVEACPRCEGQWVTCRSQGCALQEEAR